MVLTNADRQAGHRARGILRDAKMGDLADLTETLRAGRAPREDEAVRLARRAVTEAEAEVREATKRLQEYLANNDPLDARNNSRTTAKEKAEQRRDAAMTTLKEAARDFAAPRQRLARQNIAKAGPVVSRALGILSSAVVSPRSRGTLADLASAIGAPAPVPTAADYKVILATITTLGQALDEAADQALEVGETWPHLLGGRPSAVLRDLLGDLE